MGSCCVRVWRVAVVALWRECFQVFFLFMVGETRNARSCNTLCGTDMSGHNGTPPVKNAIPLPRSHRHARRKLSELM